MKTTPYQGILLLGPTGSGKTPLGSVIARRGFRGERCAHFDFGAELRRAVEPESRPRAILTEEAAFLRNVLASGALLEDKDFPLAEKILQAFLASNAEDCHTRIVLNGLPRHVGQAEAIGHIVQVATVIHLECSAETVLARLRSNIGGDRAGRDDDQLAMVRAKLATFARRTAPLVEFYADLGATILSLGVTADTTPDDAWRRLCDGGS